MARPNWEYIRIDVLLPDHPKLDGLSYAARWTLIELWCWCGKNTTDGFVRDAKWKAFGPPGARAALVGAGLAKRVKGGYRMHDYLDHQRSLDEIKEMKAKRSAAGKASAEARAKAKALAEQDAEQSAEQDAGRGDAEILTGNTSTHPGTDPGSDRVPDLAASPFEDAERPNAQVTAGMVPNRVLNRLGSKPATEAEAEAEAEENHTPAEVPDGPLEGVIHRPFTAESGISRNGSPPPPGPGPPASRRQELETERDRQINALSAWEREHPSTEEAR